MYWDTSYSSCSSSGHMNGDLSTSSECNMCGAPNTSFCTSTIVMSNRFQISRLYKYSRNVGLVTRYVCMQVVVICTRLQITRSVQVVLMCIGMQVIRSVQEFVLCCGPHITRSLEVVVIRNGF